MTHHIRVVSGAPRKHLSALVEGLSSVDTAVELVRPNDLPGQVRAALGRRPIAGDTRWEKPWAAPPD